MLLWIVVEGRSQGCRPRPALIAARCLGHQRARSGRRRGPRDCRRGLRRNRHVDIVIIQRLVLDDDHCARELGFASGNTASATNEMVVSPLLASPATRGRGANRIRTVRHPWRALDLSSALQQQVDGAGSACPWAWWPGRTIRRCPSRERIVDSPHVEEDRLDEASRASRRPSHRSERRRGRLRCGDAVVARFRAAQRHQAVPSRTTPAVR